MGCAEVGRRAGGSGVGSGPPSTVLPQRAGGKELGAEKLPEGPVERATQHALEPVSRTQETRVGRAPWIQTGKRRSRKSPVGERR